MACYAYSVLTCWFSSVYSGAGSRPSSGLMAKQVVIASSVTPGDFNDRSHLLETTYDIPDIVQPTKLKGEDTVKVIISQWRHAILLWAMRIVHLPAQDQSKIWRMH